MPHARVFPDNHPYAGPRGHAHSNTNINTFYRDQNNNPDQDAHTDAHAHPDIDALYDPVFNADYDSNIQLHRHHV